MHECRRELVRHLSYDKIGAQVSHTDYFLNVQPTSQAQEEEEEEEYHRPPSTTNRRITTAVKV